MEVNSLSTALLCLLCMNNFITASLANYNGNHVCRLQNDSCDTLYLLNILPYPDGNGPSLFDRGAEVVPAGHLALRQINSHSDILRGYNLELITAESEPCDRKTTIQGQSNFLRHTIHNPDPNCVVGVVGLYCSTVTQAVSSIASYPNIGYIQVSTSASPLLRKKDKNYQHLFHTIASSTVYNKALIAMMKKLSWSRIGQVYDPVGLYLQSTANNFADAMHKESSLELITRIPFLSSNSTHRIFNILNAREARISYWSLTYQEAAESLCEAYKRQFLWPSYIYIMHEHSLRTILSANVSCSHEEMLKAAEGIYFVNYRLQNDASIRLVSGLTYDEYWQQLSEETNRFSNGTQRGTAYANPLYDHVWAFALALNNSLDKLSQLNLSFSDYNPGKSDIALNISEVIESNLKLVSFEGATGAIKFSENLEVKSFVNIYQVRKGKQELVGVYDPYGDYFNSTSGGFPEDQFETIHSLLPIWIGLVIFLMQAIVFFLITFNLVCFVIWRNVPSIKATGLPLSIIIIVGCYVLCLAPVAQTIGAVAKIDNTSFTVLCNVEKWLQLLGIPLIYATLFFRLLRVFHLFRANNHMKRTGKYWSDPFLIIYILLMCSLSLLTMIAWTVFDPLKRMAFTYYNEKAQPPHYEEAAYCDSNNTIVWIIVHFSLIIVVIVMVVFLSIQTRHVQRQEFKDTKMVNIFVFGTVIFAAFSIPLWLVFVLSGIGLGAFIMNWLGYFFVSFHCQLCLFVPKVFPVLCHKRKSVTFSIRNKLFV